MKEKSFEQILREKMAGESHSESFSQPPIEPTHRPFIFNFGMFRRKTFGSVSAYQQEQESRKSESIPETPPKKEATATQKTTVEWSFHQQLAIQQLTSLGANLNLNSNYREVKRAYRMLIRLHHPDHSADTPEDKERLQATVEAFRLFESEMTATEACGT